MPPFYFRSLQNALLASVGRLWASFGPLSSLLGVIPDDFGRRWTLLGRLLVDFGRLLVDFGRLWTPLRTIGRPCAVKAQNIPYNLNLFEPQNEPKTTPKIEKVRPDTTSKKQHKQNRKTSLLD